MKFHPSDSHILASGCLGCEVRVWHIQQKCCLLTTRFEYSIISLSFHPQGSIISIASGPELHLLDWTEKLHKPQRDQLSKLNEYSRNHYLTLSNALGLPPSSTNLIYTRVTHSRNIRAVIFHPNGKVLLAAAPDPPRQPHAPLTPCRFNLFPILVQPSSL